MKQKLEQTFHDLRTWKYLDQQMLYCDETSIGEFRSTKILNGFVGKVHGN